MPKGNRGGRRGTSSGGVSLSSLLKQAKNRTGGGGSIDWENGEPYTDDNNPNLLKYQGQEDDKTANFLASTDRTIDLNDPKYADGYSYHDIPLNKLLLRLDITKGPTVLNSADFKAYCAATGQTPMYRGWSGQAAVDRFMNATHNHVGNGVYGDGYYFTPDRYTAQSYGSKVTELALSPNARVISYSDLRAAMSKASPRLQSALSKAGNYGSGRTYGGNDGEAQFALKMGYNVVDHGHGYLYGITADAFVIRK